VSGGRSPRPSGSPARALHLERPKLEAFASFLMWQPFGCHLGFTESPYPKQMTS
jgi:hypothetical protein